MNARINRQYFAIPYTLAILFFLIAYYAVAVQIPDASPLHVIGMPIFALAEGWLILYVQMPIGGPVVGILLAVIYLYVVSVFILAFLQAGRTVLSH